MKTVENHSSSMMRILPVMFGFFIMGFVDIIGMANNYIKHDFADLTDSIANLISLSCFIWFFLCAIPTGMLMNRIGRKKTVALSFCVTALAMLVPLADYSFGMMLVTFSLVGIGNTILQVALNPLVTNVVTPKQLTGTLTLGQFIKAVSSFLGPIIVAWAVGTAYGWKMIFLFYAATSLLAFVWLWATPIPESEPSAQPNVSFLMTLSLLKDPYILAFFLGIVVLVGVDVSINLTFPKLMMERCGLPLSEAGMGNSVYFFARTVGAFVGGLFLLRMSEVKFYVFSIWLALVGLLMLAVCQPIGLVYLSIVVFGLGYANLFSIIFSLSMKRLPSRANEVSALLIVGLVGGGILPPILGLCTDSFGSQLVAVIFLICMWGYMFWLTRRVKSVSPL
ncbi:MULTISPECIES: MFS transporter [Prevotellaceae]|uniref:Glucose/galactose transporter n=3 Tax=Prevotellaceae TaxID=171552 RepID=F9D2V6_PREDD|nr:MULTISPECIES: MFS transporter [Prevotellaceae]EGQ15423.1 glucose/galactose transporter [Prevotella dentalis DSM 3688]